MFAFATTLVLRAKAPKWRGRPYVGHAFLWATVGMVLANALLIATLCLGATLMPAMAQREGFIPSAIRLIWVAAAVLGPFFASLGGWLFGLAAGLLIASGRARSSVRAEAASA